MPSASMLTPIPMSRLSLGPAIKFSTTPIARLRRISQLLLIDMDLHEKMEMTKTRLSTENVCCQWYYWLIIHIPQSRKKSESYTKQKILRFFELKTDNKTPTDYKPKTIANAFEGRHVEYKAEKYKMSSIKGYLENFKPHLCDIFYDLKKSVE